MYGVDLSFKYEARRFYIWGAYSLGYVTRTDSTETYPPVFDRRHNLNLVGTYQLGKKREWEFGARWNFGSGFPFTLTQGFYNNVDFSDGIGTDVYGGNGGVDDLGILYSNKRNDGRLPYYHRLDLSLKRAFSFSKYTKLEITASATNVYDRPNIFYFDRVRYTRVNQLPLLPSLSIAGLSSFEVEKKGRLLGVISKYVTFLHDLRPLSQQPQHSPPPQQQNERSERISAHPILPRRRLRLQNSAESAG